MTEDKFILMGLNDDRAEHVAEVLKNKTCKKILDYLAEMKEASEQDISRALGIPINTIEYNLEKLVKSGLVDKAKNFFWSVKGKKIPMYKLARKHIIISPNKKPSMDYLKSILPVILIAAAIIALLLMLPKQQVVESQLKHFNSYSDLNNFLKENYEGSYGGRGLGMAETAASTSVPTAAGSQKASSTAAADYSQTNIQVEGVDEPDIVKNDGKYIYAVSGNKISIVDAYPAENMKILSEINVSGIGNIFVNDNKLIVFANSYNAVPYKTGVADAGIAMESIRCLGCGYGESVSLVYVYDITDRENPKLENNLSTEGNYIDSRMIGDYVYVISKKYVNIENPQPPIYAMNGVETKVAAEDIYYFPYSDSGYTFTSVAALNVKNRELNNKVYLIGASGTIYVSQDNIYLTHQKTFNYKQYTEKLAEEVYLPLLPDEQGNKIKNILDSDKLNYEKLSRMQELVNEYRNKLNTKEMSDFSDKLMKKLEEFNINIQKENEKTVIDKITINKKNIEYVSSGEVPGNVLNQFSMDEYKGYFRIATTTGNWQVTSLNHLYVLDENLEIVGKVEDLASGERIYSTRFLGDRAYMVTFRQVDPLFVIDLSKENPEVLGYLKVTGYSSYLHPYDENTIIGIGMEANEQGRVSGMKIALFDVSDVKNPVQKAKYEFEKGSYSQALYEHKAFLFDKDKELLVIPVQTYNYQTYNDARQGVYVFKMNLGGIELKGTITHDDKEESLYGPAKDDPIGAERKIYSQNYIKIAENSWEINNSYYGYYSRTIWTDEYMDSQPGGVNYHPIDYSKQIQRSLYMDDVLYTISNAKIKANNLQTIDEINKVDLGYEEDVYPIYETAVSSK